jgi:hypothetical protein
MNTDLALIEYVDSRTTTTEDLRVVLVNGPVGILNSRNVFNHDNVVGMLAIAFRSDLGALDKRRLASTTSSTTLLLLISLLLNCLSAGQVVAIIVAEMVVGGNRKRLDTSVDEELGKDGLELGLTRLEIITTNEGVMTLSELNGSWNKGVLGSTVGKRLAFQDGRNGEEGGGGDLGVGGFDGSKEVVRSVVNPGMMSL